MEVYVIFDLEGTLTQTMRCYLKSWEMMAREQGLNTDAAFDHLNCPPDDAAMLKKILKKSRRFYSPQEQMAITAQQSDFYDELMKELGEGAWLPGAKEALNELKDSGVTLGAVANGALPGRMLLFLKEKKLFSSIPREVDFAFQLSDTARRFQCLPEACLLVTAYESSVLIAKEMGMKVLKIGSACEQADYTASNIKNVFWRQVAGVKSASAVK